MGEFIQNFSKYPKMTQARLKMGAKLLQEAINIQFKVNESQLNFT